MSDPYALILAGAALLTALTVFWQKIGKPAFALFQGTSQFLSDWKGEPARPGHDAELGVMERLRNLETGARTNAEHIAAIKEQVQNSHKTNLRDDLDRQDRKLDDLTQQLTDHIAAVNVTNDERGETDRTIGHLAEALPVIANSTPPDTAA